MTTELQDAPLIAKFKPVMLGQLKPAECRHNRWSGVIDPSVSKEMVTQSQTWSITSDRFNYLDIIECVWADRSAYCELLVLSAGRGHCTVHMLSYHQLPTLLVADTSALPPGYDCRYAGPIANAKGGYQIVRLADSVIMVDGHSSKESALQELLAHASMR